MCEPTTALMIGGLALSAGSSMMQMSQAAKNQAGMINARNEANVATAEDMKRRQEQSQGVFSDALNTYSGDNAPKAQNDATSKREQAITGNMNTALTNYSPTGGEGVGPTVVKSEIARKTAQALNLGKQQAINLSKMGGTNDFNFNNQIALGRTGGQLNDMSTLARGAAAMHGIESETAYNNAYNPPSPYLEGTRAVGQGLTAYGFGQMGDPLQGNFLGGSKASADAAFAKALR